MEFKTKTIKIIKLKDLSPAILNEIWITPNTIFWAKVPKTIKEVEEFPEWNAICREADFTPGEFILLER